MSVFCCTFVGSAVTAASITSGDCNFEKDTCQYENPVFEYGKFIKNKVKWERIQGDIKSVSALAYQSHRPFADHTLNNPTGKPSTTFGLIVMMVSFIYNV